MKEVHLVRVGDIEGAIELDNGRMHTRNVQEETERHCREYAPIVREIRGLLESDVAKAVEIIRKNQGAQAYPYCRIFFADVYDTFGNAYLGRDELRQARACYHQAKDLAQRTLDAFDESLLNNETNAILFMIVKHIGDTFMRTVELERGKPIEHHYQNGKKSFIEANNIFQDRIIGAKGIYENTTIISIYTLAKMYSIWGITATLNSPNPEEMVAITKRGGKELRDAFNKFLEIVPYAKNLCQEAAALYTLCESMLKTAHPFPEKAQLEHRLPTMVQYNQTYFDFLSEMTDKFESARKPKNWFT